MKRLIVCLTLAAIALVPAVQAGEKTDKTKAVSTAKAKDSCAEKTACSEKTACCEKDTVTKNKVNPFAVKGAALLAKR